ncbi:Dihydroorotase [Liberibacter crescens BT-1]|uniref:Dihydroorotase n=1 Tax=Liberibacter crescens (strain BT-1) TaxID=1215343 RepID=L0EWB6_LIBCB|nr:dihydroorotase [Liberibacter crescens]AGA64948.1 Dihydroorotase [Liberibacter crescens BT-1]AMC12969.1 dihydroorotase [Liberibacter crescens]
MKPIVLNNIRIIDPSRNLDETGAIIIKNGLIADAGYSALNQGFPEEAIIHDCKGLVAAPGLIDARVNTGEPGEEYRETIVSAANAAVSGGVTSFIMMPFTSPVIDSVPLVKFVLNTAKDKAIANVYPAASLTKGMKGKEISEIGLLQEAGAVTFVHGPFSFANTQILYNAMNYTHMFKAVVTIDTNDYYLGSQGVMNEGLLSSWLGLSPIIPESEIIPLERDLRIAKRTGGHYHAPTLSLPQSVSLLQKAKECGVNASCGVSINNLTLNENDIGQYQTSCKIIPTLRSEEDRLGMINALAEGTIDIIVSDHNPQTSETKHVPFSEASFGAIGLETMLAAALRLYHNNQVSLIKLLEAMSTRPAKIFGIPGGTLRPGSPADIVVIDLDYPWVARSKNMVSLSKNTPFENANFSGRVLETYVSGKRVYTLGDS